MTHADLCKYWIPAADSLFRDARTGGLFKLEKLLGSDEFTVYRGRRPYEDTSSTDEVKNLLVMLTGPHAKTVLQMYRIRRGLK